MTEKDEEFRVCTCIALNCWHPKGRCEEPPTIRGGVCYTCRAYTPPKDEDR